MPGPYIFFNISTQVPPLADASLTLSRTAGGRATPQLCAAAPTCFGGVLMRALCFSACLPPTWLARPWWGSPWCLQCLIRCVEMGDKV